jgi:hypothetical protein
MFDGGTGFDSRGTTERWHYKYAMCDYANNRGYNGNKYRGRNKDDYDHGWLDAENLHNQLNNPERRLDRQEEVK